MAKCMKCDRELVKTDIALHKKIVNRTAQEYMCISCLAEYFKTTVEDLESMIEDFKRAGCTMFR
jgi:uncharacterized protein YlaI